MTSDKGPISTLKNFFNKKKTDAKFRKAGVGHSLTEAPVHMVVPKHVQSVNRQEPSSAEINAGNAAIARLHNKSKSVVIKPKIPVNRTTKCDYVDSVSESATELSLDQAPVASDYVKFSCALFEETYSFSDINQRISEYLLSQLANEPIMASALILQTLNKSSDKIESCVSIISKYIDNIANNPEEEKYRCIRINNKVFQDKVICLQGSEEYLQAIGFVIKQLPGPNTEELEDFYVFQGEDIEELRKNKEILLQSEPIIPELDRSIHVFYPSDRITRMQVPDCFYNLNINEIKKEQAMKREAVEKLGMLRTKEMRERERQQALRKYRYSLIRIKFPDNIIIQGTFKTIEKVSAINDFVTKCMKYDFLPFTLSNLQTRQSITNEELTIAESELAPASVLVCSFDTAILNEIAKQRKDFSLKTYVRKDLMDLIENL